MNRETASYNKKIKIIHSEIDKRYRLSWNFGKSACTFDTLGDLIEFAQKDLPKIIRYDLK